MPSSLRLRGPETSYPSDPKIWLASHKMTQTEVSLRLAIYLLKSRLAATDVTVTLAAHELTRRDAPQFPVELFLTQAGFIKQSSAGGECDWHGSYHLTTAPPNHPHLILGDDADGADVVTTVRPISPRVLASAANDGAPVDTCRLIVQTSCGPIGGTRSPAEHKWLRNAIGRVMTYEQGNATDILAVAAPRSKRFRDLATRWRGAEGILRTAAMILLVDRAGTVDGLPYQYRAPSPAFVVPD